MTPVGRVSVSDAVQMLPSELLQTPAPRTALPYEMKPTTPMAVRGASHNQSELICRQIATHIRGIRDEYLSWQCPG